jgi:hypothetical protein
MEKEGDDSDDDFDYIAKKPPLSSRLSIRNDLIKQCRELESELKGIAECLLSGFTSSSWI